MGRERNWAQVWREALQPARELELLRQEAGPKLLRRPRVSRASVPELRRELEQKPRRWLGREPRRGARPATGRWQGPAQRHERELEPEQLGRHRSFQTPFCFCFCL